MKYQVSYLLNSDLAVVDGATDSEKKANHRLYHVHDEFVLTSNATRAISAVVNLLKERGKINGKADVKILEVKLVA